MKYFPLCQAHHGPVERLTIQQISKGKHRLGEALHTKIWAFKSMTHKTISTLIYLAFPFQLLAIDVDLMIRGPWSGIHQRRSGWCCQPWVMQMTSMEWMNSIIRWRL